MKKAFVILSLTLSIIFVVNVASTYKIDESSMAISSDTTINSNIKKNLALLNGTWMLTVSNDFSTNNANTRYMRFDTKGQFKTINANGSPFNSGEFYLTADNKLITIHNKTKNLLRKTANYYQYSIERNNLTIKGAYLRPLMNNHYETFQVNEVWERIEDDSLFDELNKPYSLWQSKFDNMHFIQSGKIISDSVKTSIMGFWISNQITNAEFKEFWNYAKNNQNKSIEWATIENNKPIVKNISYSEITSIKINKENWPAKNYFESEKYNDDPVIGVSDQLANFYCIWKSIGLNNKINNSNLPTVNYFIPTPTQLTHATTTYPSLLSNNELGFRITLKD